MQRCQAVEWKRKIWQASDRLYTSQSFSTLQTCTSCHTTNVTTSLPKTSIWWRRRFCIGTRQRSWTRPVAWELIPLALWAGEGGAQLSQHTAQVGRINRLDWYTCSPGDRAYCCAGLAVSSLATALTTASTHFTIPRRVEGWVDLVGWLRTVDSHPSKY